MAVWFALNHAKIHKPRKPLIKRYILTVFTDAWFTANATVSTLKVNDDTGTIGVSGAVKQISGVKMDVLAIDVSFSAGTYLPTGQADLPANYVEKELELAHYSSSAASANKYLAGGYLDTAGSFHESTDLYNANDAFYGTVTVHVTVKDSAFTDDKITVGDNTYTKASVIGMLNLRTDVPLVASVGETRARIFANNATAAAGDPNSDISTTISLASLTDDNYVEWTCFAYIYGGLDGSTSTESSPVTPHSDANVSAVGAPAVTVTVGDVTE